MTITFLAFPMPLIWWQLLLADAVCALGGFIIGIFGVGGGALFVPALLQLPGVPAQLAVGTVLVASIPVALSRSLQLAYYGHLRPVEALPLMFGAAFGGVTGQFLIKFIPGAVIAFIVAFAAFYVGIKTQSQARKALLAERERAAKAAAMSTVESPAQEDERDFSAEVPSDGAQGQPPAPPESPTAAEPLPGELNPSTSEAVAAPSVAVPSKGELPKAAKFFIGYVAAVIASVSGTGGPLVLFPIMLFLRPDIDMKALVGVSNCFAGMHIICSAVAALVLSDVDLGIALIVSVSATVASLTGGLLQERMQSNFLKRVVGVMLILVGAVLAVRTVVPFLEGAWSGEANTADMP